MIVSASAAAALGETLLALLGAGAAAPIASFLKRWVGRRHSKVSVRLPSGVRVDLELDGHLSSEEVSRLVTAAVQSAQAGDEAAVRQTVEASHTASARARVESAD